MSNGKSKNEEDIARWQELRAMFGWTRERYAALSNDERKRIEAAFAQFVEAAQLPQGQRDGSGNEKKLVMHANRFKPGDEPISRMTAYGLLTQDAEGIVTHNLDGSRHHFHPDGSSDFLDPLIRRIAIHDLGKVLSYRRSAVFDTVAHHIEFEGDGRFWFVMDAQGTVLEAHARNMNCFVGDDGVIILFGPGIPPDAPPEARALRRAD